jgi:hypothetical protein
MTLRTVIIPVAFDITVDDPEVTEDDVARGLARTLERRGIAGRPIEYVGRIDSWWMPNHPAADGSDHEAVLVWIPMKSYAGRYAKGESPQQSVDTFMETMSRWNGSDQG